MKQKLLFFFTVLLVGFSVNAQNYTLSKDVEISVITIGPGSELFDKFGHSAFRVNDPYLGIDIVYNYGKFDFNTPNFYLKFARGKLLYELGYNRYKPFLNYYKGQNRWMKEQVLNISHSEKQQLFEFLQNNAKPENKEYLYDFFYDNCATKMHDVLEEVLGESLTFIEDEYVEKPYTFRELIHRNLNHNSWGVLGIDTALGSVIDKNATSYEYMFLPEFIFENFATASYLTNGKRMSLVSSTNDLFQNEERKEKSNIWLSPLFILSILSVLILYITYRDYKNKKRTRILDIILFSITGIIGVLLFLLWFATDHTATAQNYNVLWAFPLNILIIAQVVKKIPKKWFRRYLKFLIIAMVLLVFHWVFKVQVFALTLIPLLIAITIRYIYLLKFYKIK